MMKSCHLLLLVCLALLLTGCCYNKQKTILEEPDFKAGKRVLVYENDAGAAGKLLRGSLRKQGIKVLKYTNKSILNINEKVLAASERDINVSSYTSVDGSPYILDLDAQVRNDLSCPTKDVTYYDLFVEIANLETKEVVFSAKASGGDDSCVYCTTNNVFDNMARLIINFWKQQE